MNNLEKLGGNVFRSIDVVAHKYLFYSELAIFRVGKTTTLKIAYYLIANDLRATPKKNERKKN